MADHDGAQAYREAAAIYKPEKVRLLFVAEAPPAAVERYFYFPNVPEQDSLWVQTMRVLYGREFGETWRERSRKRQWLRRFQGDGCFLIDALPEPVSGDMSSRARVRLIQERAEESAREAAALAPEQILLVKSTVYDGLIGTYRAAGLPVVNRGPVPFPGSGQQARFRSEIESLVATGRLTLRAD